MEAATRTGNHASGASGGKAKEERWRGGCGGVFVEGDKRPSAAVISQQEVTRVDWLLRSCTLSSAARHIFISHLSQPPGEHTQT